MYIQAVVHGRCQESKLLNHEYQFQEFICANLIDMNCNETKLVFVIFDETIILN